MRAIFLLLCFLTGILATDYIITTNLLDVGLQNSLKSLASVESVVCGKRKCIINVNESFMPAVEQLQAQNIDFDIEAEQTIDSMSSSWGPLRIDEVRLEDVDSSFDPIGTGLGTHIYIVDAGILTTHNEFKDPSEQIGQRADLAYEVGVSTGPICGSHGTAVASIAAGKTVGIARRASIHSVKVSTKSGTSESDCSILLSALLEGLMWILDNGEPKSVINLSLSGSASSSLDSMIADLRNDGHVIVAAAGNAGENNGACDASPARSVACITVAGSTIQDTRWTGSNYGGCIQYFAPGLSLRTASAIGNSAYLSSFTGTSASAPHVAGTAAVVRQVLEDEGGSNTANAVEEAMRELSVLGAITNSAGTVNRLIHVGDGISAGSTTRFVTGILLWIFL